MLTEKLHLPDRPIKFARNTISRAHGTLFGAIVVGSMLAFFVWWQAPAIQRDWEIRKAPVTIESGDIQNGNCTTSKGFFVGCDAHLSYSYQGKHHESDISLFFVDAHVGDYDAYVVISGDNPELATLSIALDKFWDRIGLLGFLLFCFAGLILGAVASALQVARARRKLAVPGHLTLIERDVDPKPIGSGYSRKQFA